MTTRTFSNRKRRVLEKAFSISLILFMVFSYFTPILSSLSIVKTDNVLACTNIVDNDGDGHGDTGVSCSGDDCDDSDATIYPGAKEICDGKDNDCDGVIDEDGCDVCLSDRDCSIGEVCDAGYCAIDDSCTDLDDDGICDVEDDCIDRDGDGYGRGEGCTDSDCNDTNPNSWRTNCFFVDRDQDGYYYPDVPDKCGDSGAMSICYGAEIPDGFTTESNGPDCDDNNPELTTNCNVCDGEIITDKADIGDSSSEIEHAIDGWSEANIHGGYGGCQDGEVCTYRQIIEDPCTEEEREASVVLHAGNGVVNTLTVRHLDGVSLSDSFEIWVGDDKVGEWIDDTQISSEVWRETSFDISSYNLSGDITFIFKATDEIWNLCPSYGQVAIDWVSIDACEEEEVCEPGSVSLLNPSFETPEVDGAWNIFNSAQVMWDVDWVYPNEAEPKLELQRNVSSWEASQGDQYAELDTDGRNDRKASVKISQEVNTFPGAKYKLIFDFSARPGRDASENILNVKISGNNGVLKSKTYSADGGSDTSLPNVWETGKIKFIANSDKTTISFADGGTPNTFGTFLDNIRLRLIDCNLAYCGDGEVNQNNEECDDGELNGTPDSRCTSRCKIEKYCGDGKINQKSEECDDGELNGTSDSHCTLDCILEPYCGDGNIDEGEQCDDGNNIDEDGCSSECTIEYCGDGVVNQEWEECDGEENCTDKCLWDDDYCRDLVLARVNISDEDVYNEGNGNMTSDIYLGSDWYHIPAGTWFVLSFHGSNYGDNNFNTYEDVPGLAVQRKSGTLRAVMHGSMTKNDLEHVDGDIEFYNARVGKIGSDSGNNKLEKGFDGAGIGNYNPNNDEIWTENGNNNQSFFWMTTDVADDGYYTPWVRKDCYCENNIEGRKYSDYTEDGLEGWEIQLLTSSGRVLATTTTDGKGYYNFNGICDGSYYLQEVMQEGWIAVNPLEGYDLHFERKSIKKKTNEEYISYKKIRSYDFYNQPLVCGHKYNFKTNEGMEGWHIYLKQLEECNPDDFWADSVISADQNGTSVPSERSDTGKALGEAQNDDTMNFYSLGMGGNLILHFDNKIVNDEGADLEIFETSFHSPSCSAYPEYVHVYASQDGQTWEDLGSKCQDSDLLFDLGSLDWAEYVKLVDESTNNGDGFDVDGVRALHCEENWTIVDEAVTDSDGHYCFNPKSFSSHNYRVEEEDRDNWRYHDYYYQDIDFTGNEALNIDFYNYSTCYHHIKGYKYNYFNEEAIEGWVIDLYDGEDNLIATTSTDVDGYYDFGDLCDGNYVVREEMQTGWKQVSPMDCSEKDYYEVSFAPFQADSMRRMAYDPHYDFINKPMICGVKYNSYNNDDSSDDTVVEGWEMSLSETTGTECDGPECMSAIYLLATTTTDSDGIYCFDIPETGLYVVSEESRDNWYAQSETSYTESFDGTEPLFIDFYNYQEVPDTCGDGVCGEGESCSTCPSDCGECETTHHSSGGGYYNYSNQGGGEADKNPSDDGVKVLGEEGAPLLELTKVADKEFANPGEEIEFTLKVKNIGNLVADSVVLKDILPAELQFVDFEGSDKTWDLGNLEPLETKEIKVKTKVKDNVPAGEYVNNAEVSAVNADKVSASADYEVKEIAVLAETGFSLSEFLLLLISLFALIGIAFGLKKRLA